VGNNRHSALERCGIAAVLAGNAVVL